jgi:hypothetical protein
MMSELVAGSAWICPPVDGWLLLAASMLGPLARPLPALAPRAIGLLLPGRDARRRRRWRPRRRRRWRWPGRAAMAARRVAASLVASAFFR